MAQTSLYVEVKLYAKSDVISIERFFHVSELEEKYNDAIESTKKFGFTDKFETLEGFTLKYVKLENVKFDGRSKKVKTEDIGYKLASLGYAIAPHVVEGENLIFGYSFSATEQLKELLNNQLEQRKQLVNEGKFINIKEIA